MLSKYSSAVSSRPGSLVGLTFVLLILALSAPLAAQNALGDTLTIIQRPIQNVPEIVVPGESFSITCLAPAGNSTWIAKLLHGNKVVPLQITAVQYLSNPARYELIALVPNLPVFELYDLMILTDGGMEDITRNAVQVLPSRKTEYYFVHITDTHMPGRTYYPDQGYLVDSTSVEDFRAVVQDINLIRPEFVLFTGDVVNEGELEAFGGLYSYGWAQNAISELEVPVFITNGNHDVGGWNSTPAPQGSARRNWWRYFGWPWLNNSSSTWSTHTQDYYFRYGQQLYIGLESYINYDNWRSYIYGGESFIYSQLTWLNSVLNLYPDLNKVLFYHYDFSHQLDLADLGVDMGLWGHIHRNSGSVDLYPYNLGTDSVCDAARAYRVVRVSNNQIQPYETLYAGSTGNNLRVNFYPSNNATADSVLAVVVNTQDLGFENTLVKFNMPPGNHIYSVSGGVLEQVDNSGDYNVCYVRVNLTHNTNRWVSLAISSTAANDPGQAPAPPQIKLWPNPARDLINLRYEASSTSYPVKIYNLRGQLVADLSSDTADLCIDLQNLDSAPLSPGVYLLRAGEGKEALQRSFVVYSR